MTITIGQFIVFRQKNPDTPNDPYDPRRESVHELVIPEEPLDLIGPSPLPPPPKVDLSSPAGVPGPLNVTLSSPSSLPPPPNVELSSPARLPAPPDVSLSSPQRLPPPPVIEKSAGDVLPPPPLVDRSAPIPLGPPPVVVPSSPSVLPPPPTVIISSPGQVPAPPVVTTSSPGAVPPPPTVVLSSAEKIPPPQKVTRSQPDKLPDPPSVKIVRSPSYLANVSPEPDVNSGYSLLGATYSPVGGASEGDLALDPIQYERQLERLARDVGPGKILLHSLIQTAMFSQNTFGNIWNPALVAPPPLVQNYIPPALDLITEQNTEEKQLGQKIISDAILGGETPPSDFPVVINPPQTSTKTHPQAMSVTKKNSILANTVKEGKISLELVSSAPKVKDEFYDKKLAFTNGVMPMRLKGDNDWGFRTFVNKDDKYTDDDVYVPLSFTDMRSIGSTFRSVYFRPTISSLNESFSPEWNKTSYFGRVDPVATYQSTTRTISFSFKLIAFSPEDVRTIYQKLHWLSSMVYPTYDKNLLMTAGPVVRLRIGDVVNGNGFLGGKGLPGIIDSLEYDYSDKIWEIKEKFKVPREVDVAVTFTVIHDLPVGVGDEGMFGGLGRINSKGLFTNTTGDDPDSPTAANADSTQFRNFGKDGIDFTYNKLSEIDSEKKKI